VRWNKWISRDNASQARSSDEIQRWHLKSVYLISFMARGSTSINRRLNQQKNVMTEKSFACGADFSIDYEDWIWISTRHFTEKGAKKTRNQASKPEPKVLQVKPKFSALNLFRSLQLKQPEPEADQVKEKRANAPLLKKHGSRSMLRRLRRLMNMVRWS